METQAQETVEGGCLCGAVRYRVPYPFVGEIGHCHCTVCRRASGAPVVTWFTVRTDDFQLIRGATRIYHSSPNAQRGFCPDCGSQITFHNAKEADLIDVTIGTLDNPERFPAAKHIWTDTRLPWLHLDEHLPEYGPVCR